MSIPKVYSAINAVAAELGRKGIPKGRTNADEQYAYRGIDDVYDRLAPLLAAHKLCILPRILERTCVDRAGLQGDFLLNVSVRAAFHLVSAEDGSAHVIETFGEALDRGDKATSKAITAAYKYAVIQTFCIPVGGSDDADSESHRLRREVASPEPDQGWEQWAADITDMLAGCKTLEAVDRVQERYRHLFTALRRERAELYKRIGDAIEGKRNALSPPTITRAKTPSKRRGSKSTISGSKEHAKD